jgi:glycosyltransferase involved in cell wall biosynthesis
MAFKIGMDVRMISHSGIGVRIQNILSHLVLKDDYEIYLFGDPEKISNFSIPSHSQVVPYFAKIYSLTEMLGHSKMKEMDLLDIPHFNIPIPYLEKCIVTIHDLIPWIMKELHSSIAKRLYLRFVLNQIKNRAKCIITVSDHTKQDFIRCIGQPKNAISTIYNGVHSNLYSLQSPKNIQDFQMKYNLPDKYFLTVGIGKGHKNFEFLIRNLIVLWNQGALDIPLLLAGTSDFLPGIMRNLPLNIKKKIFILPRIPDLEMPILYQSSYALLYPSLYEGFGFPVVEAQAVGCPVLSSNASVLPEILNSSAEFFDPKADSNIQDKIIELSNADDSYLNEMRTKGFQNVKRFSWEKGTKEIQVLYEQYCQKSSH